MTGNIDNLTEDALQSSVPLIRLNVSTTVVAPGHRVEIRVTSEDELHADFHPLLTLVSDEDEVVLRIPLEAPDFSAVMVVPETLQLGRYELQVSLDDWILDELVFEVGSPEAARKAMDFANGVRLRIRALDEIKAGNFDRAFELNQDGVELLERAGNVDVAARAWKELGESLLKREQVEKAIQALKRAHDLFTKLRDLEGKAATLQLIGEGLALQNQQAKARKVLEAARSMADTSGYESIGLQCRMSLWRLSTVVDIWHRRYYWDLVEAVLTAKSPAARHQAISLCYEIERNRYIVLWDDASTVTSTVLVESIVHIQTLAWSRTPQLHWKAESLSQIFSLPWLNSLAIFTSAILTALLSSLGRYLAARVNLDVPLKVVTTRTPELETFVVAFAHEEPQPVIESIQGWFQQDDWHYYEEVARAVGAAFQVNPRRRPVDGFVELHRSRRDLEAISDILQQE